MNRLISLSLALSLIGASTAMAHGIPGRAAPRAYGPGYVHGNEYNYRNEAAAIGAGLVALGVITALMAPDRSYYGPGVYAPRYGRVFESPRQMHRGYGHRYDR